MTAHNPMTEVTVNNVNSLPTSTHTSTAGTGPAQTAATGAGDTVKRASTCASARFGVVAMFVALVVTSVMTLAAEAQLPSTTPGPDGGTSGTNSSSDAGLYVFAVVVVVIIGGAIVLYLRNRKPTA